MGVEVEVALTVVLGVGAVMRVVVDFDSEAVVVAPNLVLKVARAVTDLVWGVGCDSALPQAQVLAWVR